MFTACGVAHEMGRQAHSQHGTCAGTIPCDASILAAAASPQGRAILQTQSGELLLYDGRALQLARLGSFPEPCPSMHILPDGTHPKPACQARRCYTLASAANHPAISKVQMPAAVCAASMHRNSILFAGLCKMCLWQEVKIMVQGI